MPGRHDLPRLHLVGGRFSVIAAGLLLALVSLGGKPPERPLPNPAPVAEPPGTPVGDVDLLGIWTAAARDTFKQVRDYQCTFVKRERIDGTLQEEQTALMQVRTHPFSVRMKFVAPKSVAGREAIYVAGRNNGKIKAKGSGALSLVGYVSLDPRDPRAMQGTRHVITEAGIGNLIQRLSQAKARPGDRGIQSLVSEVEVNRRPAVRIEVIDPNADGHHTFYRSVVYFDKETNLPVRFDAYDRPKAPGTAGDLIESYTYVDLRFNLGLSDTTFGH